MKKNRLYRELDLNVDTLEGKEIFAAKKIEATGDELIKTINANPGVRWMIHEVPKISTIKHCAELIEQKKEFGTAGFKLAKAILKLIKEPRNAAERRTKRRGK